MIHEIADSSVPVYTSDLLALACADTSLATDEPELGPAFDGSPTLAVAVRIGKTRLIDNVPLDRR